MQNKEKIAIFDFCETLANFQTADAFIKYVREQSGSKRMRFLNNMHTFLIKARIIAILERLLPVVSLNKKLLSYQLKGLPLEQVVKFAQEYYETEVRVNLIPQTISKLKDLQKEGYRIIILSAGFDVYLKYFCSEYNIPLNNLICTRIQFKENKCTGKFVGEDCINEHKISYLETSVKKDNTFSLAFSDSPSDLPMLNWADKSYVVLREDRKDWGKKYNFENIKWS